MAIQKRTTTKLLPGSASHTRTQDCYMGALLDAVSLDDWREVVTGAVQAAKSGDAQARAWLGHYLVGRPESKAPTAVNVIVNQLRGRDPVVNRLVDILETPSFDFGDNKQVERAQITRQIELEIADTMQQAIATNRHRGQPSLTAPLPHHPACGSAPGGSRS
jgi:hypothetical protein